MCDTSRRRRLPALNVPTMLLALFLASAPATAQLVKCAGEGGRVDDQATPCPVGTELRNLETHPATVSVIPPPPIPGTTARIRAASTGRQRGAGGTQKKDKAQRGDAAERRFLHPGMHEGEVLARAGPPDLKSGGSGKHARWTYLPAPADAQTITTVLFGGGKVVDVERKVVK
jgi:hypothetical protein